MMRRIARLLCCAVRNSSGRQVRDVGHIPRWRSRLFPETLESRICLSAIGFAKHEVVCCMDRPETSTIADFDQDGDFDIAVTNSRSLSVLENDAGVFRQSFFLPYPPTRGDFLNAADLDQDGDLDIVTELGWHENLGRGTFGDRNRILSGGSIVAVSDVDGDGVVDVIGVDDGKLLWQSGSAPTDVGQAITIASGDFDVHGVAARDFDNDGDIDLLVDSRDNSTSHYFANLDGRGTFGAPRQFAFDAYDKAVADFDGDGDLDVATDDIWYQNNGDAHEFAPQTAMPPGERCSRPLAAADLDDDGHIDLVCGGGVAWSKNLGGGVFRALARMDTSTHREREVDAVDLDQDGDLDIVVTARNAAQLVWHENLDGRGTFSPTQTILPQVRPTAAPPADVDNNGLLDLIVTADYGEAISWYPNLGHGRPYPSARTIVPESPNVQWRDASPTDVDGDGDLDIVATRTRFRPIRTDVVWLENTDGQGAFAEDQTIADSEPNPALHVADIDSDGRSDLLVQDSDQVRWFANVSDGQFEDGQPITSPAGQMTVVDIDNDQDVDLLFTNRGTRTVSLVENLGQGESFAAPVTLLTVGALPEVTTDIDLINTMLPVDVDNDSHIDIVVGAGAGIAIFRNRGDRTFDAMPSYTIATSRYDVNHIVAGDFNNDGKIDLGLHAWSTYVLLENGNAPDLFEVSYRITYPYVRTVVSNLADVDRDGDLDIVVSSSGNSEVAWYENRVLGDTNDDGVFDSADLAAALAAGKFEQGKAGRATWQEGDWNGDGVFDSRDLVLAFQAGHYVAT